MNVEDLQSLPDPYDTVHTKLEPWMIGRLLEVRLKLAVKSWSSDWANAHRQLHKTMAGRLTSYKARSVSFSDGSAVDWTTPPERSQSDTKWEFEIQVVPMGRDPELASADIQNRLAFQESTGRLPRAPQVNRISVSSARGVVRGRAARRVRRLAGVDE